MMSIFRWRFKVSAFFSFSLGLVFALVSHMAIAQVEEDDDFLLMTIPAIMSGAKSGGDATGIEKLHGTWFIETEELGGEYYTFDRATVEVSPDDSNIYFISGKSSIFDDFSSEWCDGGMLGAYSENNDFYLVVCNWGYPTYDLGSIYQFNDAVDGALAIHRFYTPSTSEIRATTHLGRLNRISNSIASASVAAVAVSGDASSLDEEKEMRFQHFQQAIKQDVEGTQSTQSTTFEHQALFEAVLEKMVR